MINILDRTGEIGRNNFGTDMKIVAYRRYDDIDVEFLDEHHYVKEHNTYSNFKSGAIKNPYDRSVYGVGYVGEGKEAWETCPLCEAKQGVCSLNLPDGYIV